MEACSTYYCWLHFINVPSSRTLHAPPMKFIFKDCMKCMWQIYDWILKMQISRTVLPGRVWGLACNGRLIRILLWKCRTCMLNLSTLNLIFFCFGEWNTNSEFEENINLRTSFFLVFWWCRLDFRNENFLCVLPVARCPWDRRKKWINQIPLWFYSRHTDEIACPVLCLCISFPS